MAKSIGSALGSGFAGITKSLDEIGEQLDAEQSAEGKSAQKKGFFEGRDERIQAGSKRPSALLSPLVALLPSSPSLRCLWMIFRRRLTADREEPRAAGAQRCRRRIWASMFAPCVLRCSSTPLPLLCCLPACACAGFQWNGICSRRRRESWQSTMTNHARSLSCCRSRILLPLLLKHLCSRVSF